MFILNKPVIVIIPASRPLIFNFVCNKPVIKPAKIPQIIDTRIANIGLQPRPINTIVMAPPKTKLPSVVMSAKSNIL